MNNKVLVKLIVPELDLDFDVFIPINEVVWKIKDMFLKCISDITNANIDFKSDFILVNRDNSRIYKNNEIIIDTDIRNSSELLFLSKIG